MPRLNLLAKNRLCLFLTLMPLPLAFAGIPLNEVTGPVYHLEFVTSKANVEGGTLLEVCGEILPINLRFEEGPSGYLARYELSIVLFNQQDDFVASSSHRDTLKAHSIPEIVLLQPSFVSLPFVLPPDR
ncbi:hypothetical protein MJD09_01795, partial [bacterium]|nr:hypothetical protein [bacterium]